MRATKSGITYISTNPLPLEVPIPEWLALNCPTGLLDHGLFFLSQIRRVQSICLAQSSLQILPLTLARWSSLSGIHVQVTYRLSLMANDNNDLITKTWAALIYDSKTIIVTILDAGN